MKDKIMFLIIGILIGAIIATSVFLIYNKTISNNNENSPEIIERTNIIISSIIVLFFIHTHS